MKVIIIALLFAVVVASESKRCRTAEDCGENECCTLPNFIFLKGKCKPLAKDTERCSRVEDNYEGSYLKKCPCESGLVCNAEKVIKSKFLDDVEIRINERCVNENEVTTGAEVTQEEVTSAESE